MPAGLQQPYTSAILKRTRSSDGSGRGSPKNDMITDPEDALLPAFLQQSEAEIDERFNQLDVKQRDRLEDPKLRSNESPWTQTASNNARLRNRYLDIRPWDNSRVKLKVVEGRSDYINASHILLKCSLTGQERCYIATQGPKEASTGHFWQMVWHETNDAAVIIMLTQLSEGEREKCYKYFPESSDSEPMAINLTNEHGEDVAGLLQLLEATWHEKSMTMMRTLQLTCNEQTKVIHHLFFQGWPDHGVPEAEDRSALLELIELSRAKNLGWENPRIVHCSAGVGRTGSFIAIEHLLAELAAGCMDHVLESDDPIFDTIDALRQQRMTMVQSGSQYNFIYQLMADAARTRIREKIIAEKMQGMMSSSGEPAHKARRFTKAMKGVLGHIRPRSGSGKSSSQGGPRSEPALSRPVSSSDAELEIAAAARSGQLVQAPRSLKSDTQLSDVFHDATESLSSLPTPLEPGPEAALPTIVLKSPTETADADESIPTQATAGTEAATAEDSE